MRRLGWLIHSILAAVLLFGQDGNELAIRMNVDLVVLQVTVRDAKGALAGKLSESNFAVLDGGERQTIRVFRHEDLAVTAGLVVDHSGSMKHRLDEIEVAARTFVRMSHPEDEMFVVNFNDGVSLGLKEGVAFSNRQDELGHAIQSGNAEGKTALYDGLMVALRHLEAGRREKKVLLLVSDGEDNSSVANLEQVTRLAIQSSATIYAIGLFEAGASEHHAQVLRRLATATGGVLHVPTREVPVAAICERVATEIRSQYTIGYFASRPGAAGVYRRVKVTVRADGIGRLTAKTRAGYFAAGSQ